MDQVKFALKIKEARKERGWTQKELAKRLQITDKAVSKWERALSMPDIELLGPISKELNIPLAELLDVEDYVITSNSSENVETLLQRLVPLMQEKVSMELKRRKRWLTMGIIVFISLSLLIIGYEATKTWYRQKTYVASEQSIYYKDLVVNNIEVTKDNIKLTITIPESVNDQYEVFTKIWYDKEDSTTAYFQYYYHEKEHLIYDSNEEYTEQSQEGYSSHIFEEEFPVSITKIIYYDGHENILWNKAAEKIRIYGGN